MTLLKYGVSVIMKWVHLVWETGKNDYNHKFANSTKTNESSMLPVVTTSQLSYAKFSNLDPKIKMSILKRTILGILLWI